MRPHHLRCLRFVAEHPGTRHPAILGGFRYYFTDPGRTRAPFRLATIEALIETGHVAARPTGNAGERIEITAKGRKALEAAS